MPNFIRHAVAAALIAFMATAAIALAAPAPPAQPDAPPVATPAPPASPPSTPSSSPPVSRPAPPATSNPAPAAPAAPALPAGPTPRELAAQRRLERELAAARELDELVRIGEAAADSASSSIETSAAVLEQGLANVGESLLPAETGGLPGPGLLVLFVLLAGTSGILAGIALLRTLARTNPRRVAIESLPNPLQLPTRAWALGSMLLLAAALPVGFA